MPDGASTATAISTLSTTFWVLIGILFSFVLPVAVRTLKKASAGLEERAEKPSFVNRIKDAWAHYGGNRYLSILLAGVVVSAGLVFLLDLEFFTERDAALAGFAWESFVQKLSATQDRGEP